MENQPGGWFSPPPALSALPPFQLPQSRRRSWNPFPSERIPLPCRSCIPSVCAAAVRATLMESVPVERIPLPCRFCVPSVWAAAVKATLMESVPVERIPLPCRFCVPSVWAAAVKATLMESVPVERIPLPLPFLHLLRFGCRSQDNGQRERPSRRTVFPMSALCARSISLAAASDYFFVWVETRVGHRVSKGNSVSCGTRLRALP